MNYQSTIYIKENLLEKLMEAVGSLHISRSKIIEALLIKYMETNRGGNEIWKMLKYQTIEKKTKARRISICWQRKVYERSCDCKKIYRKSVSLIIAQSIELYLDEIIDELGDDEETYKYRDFSLIFHKHYPDYSIYVTIWDEPGSEILDKLYLF